jgi:hypothetical protein
LRFHRRAASVAELRGFSIFRVAFRTAHIFFDGQLPVQLL